MKVKPESVMRFTDVGTLALRTSGAWGIRPHVT